MMAMNTQRDVTSVAPIHKAPHLTSFNSKNYIHEEVFPISNSCIPNFTIQRSDGPNP